MIPNACACLGPQFNEPHCPCTMNRLNLPPSEERLADQAYWNSPEGLAIIAAELQALRDLFDKPHKRRNDDPI